MTILKNLSIFFLCVIVFASALFVIKEREASPLVYYRVSQKGGTTTHPLGVTSSSSVTRSVSPVTIPAEVKLSTEGAVHVGTASVEEPVVNTAKTVSVPVSTPGPLIREEKPLAPSAPPTHENTPPPPSSSLLDGVKIWQLTNDERVRAGLPPLLWNGTLSAIAKHKAQDMIAGQYFAHVSPSGVNIETLAERFGYAYLNIGENLALGDFDDSADVVLGWMNSPGHRANILHKDFTELGVFAVKGNWEGRDTWFAVQEFGRPKSACPEPSATLRARVDLYEGQVKTLGVTLATAKADLEGGGWDPEMYNKKVADYNTIVALYNDILRSLKSDVAEYNTEIKAYNTCLEN